MEIVAEDEWGDLPLTRDDIVEDPFTEQAGVASVVFCKLLNNCTNELSSVSPHSGSEE